MAESQKECLKKNADSVSVLSAIKNANK